jgi:hypothetical protein
MAKSRKSRWVYVEYDGAYFRKAASSGLALIDDVWTTSGWEDYTGDRAKRYAFGNQVQAWELPAGAADAT